MVTGSHLVLLHSDNTGCNCL